MSTKLNGKQVEAIYWLARGETGRDVARNLKIRHETLSRWKQNPEFSAAYEAAVRALQEDAQQHLLGVLHGAFTALSRELDPQAFNKTADRMEWALSFCKLVGIERLMPIAAAVKE